MSSCDGAIVIGGGFYGAVIAIYLASQRNLRVTLVEREPGLLRRASFHNQARVHGGYHYPRSFTTGYRSRLNMPRFALDWPAAVPSGFEMVYAVARRNSKVTALQFVRYCERIGARIEPASPAVRALFDPRMVEDAFLVEEHVFDASKLADWVRNELAVVGVDVYVNTRALSIKAGGGAGLSVMVQDQRTGDRTLLRSRHVMNCTYAGLNEFVAPSAESGAGLKHEITEMPLVEVPKELGGLGITIMDGPFFSLMPFPARALHTLSHVRYTPHRELSEHEGRDAYDALEQHGRTSRVDRMLRDSARYVPVLRQARHVDSLFEIKTVLRKNEVDDGRPIMFLRHQERPGMYSILGGKIDNIYDVLERLSEEEL